MSLVPTDPSVSGPSSYISNSRRNLMTALVVVMVLAPVALMVHGRHDRLNKVLDCVNKEWESYETETGRMPPEELERRWFLACQEWVPAYPVRTVYVPRAPKFHRQMQSDSKKSEGREGSP